MIASWQMGVLGPILSGLRLWDVAGANRVDAFAAISAGVKRRSRSTTGARRR